MTIPLLRGGLFYQNDWINLTSMITYISKSNNIDQQNVTKPGTTQSKTTLLIYDIKTLGWTTSAEINPFKGFHLHALFTYQKLFTRTITQVSLSTMARRCLSMPTE